MNYKNLKVYPHIAKVIPLAFDESLSYYECICNITNHINNEIIPIVNESNEMVYNINLDLIDLKNYVDENMLTKDVNDLTYYTLTNDLSTVALTGDYNDLINKPTIPDVSNFITKDVDDLTYYTKSSDLSTVATTGDYDDLLDKPTIPDVSNFITKDVNDLTYYTKTSDLSTVATTGDYDDLLDKPTLFSGSYNDLTDKPTIPPTMTILSYGNSTWNDFITAYNSKSIVYCRASSNSNPALNSQTRLAFMAYVNNETNPTEVEFQYYRSVSSHTDSQQGDQVFVYKLTNASGGTWSVITRNTFSKVIAGTGLSSSYSSGNITLSTNLATVASTGSYNDLTNKPTIPTVPTNVSAFNNDSGYITKSVNDLTNYTLSSNLSTVATSGSYNDLSNKPTLLEVTSGTWTPVMENATVTYTKRVGTYKKIDKIVFINCLLEGNITASSSPYYAIISGLPFAPNNKYSGNIGIHYNCCVNDQNQLVRFYNDNNTGKIELCRDNAEAGGVLAQWNAGLGTFYLYISGFYFID